MPPAPRGSATLPARQLAELRKVAESSGKLVYWFPRGQPNPDAIFGVIVAPRDRLGSAIEKIAGVKGTNLRFDVFPLGIPIPEEFLVGFEQGFRGGMH